MKLLVGLGNPGQKYENTRHNIGFLVLDAFAKKYDEAFVNKKSYLCEFAQIMLDSEKTLLCKPQTFMNASGKSVLEILHKHPVTPEELLVIYDDADLPFGDIRFKASGSSAGHRGMDSVLSVFERGTAIARLRIGIGRPPHSDIPLEDFVLQSWTQSEKSQLEKIQSESIDHIEQFLSTQV